MHTGFMKKNTLEKLCCIFIAVYVACAMAFECTANTSKYSTLAIYVVFLIGVLYIFVRKSVKLNGYAFSLYFLYCYMLTMSFASGASAGMGSTVSYYYLTCAIVCYIVYYVTYYNPTILRFLCLAVIVGALILTIRVVQSYGGITAMLDYASLEGERRVGGDIINENILGLYMVNALLCSMFLLSQAIKRKYLYWLAFIPCGVIFVSMTLMSGSKKAIAALFLGICGLLWFLTNGQKVKKRLQMIVIIVFAISVILWAIRTLPYFATISLRLDGLVASLTGESGSTKTDISRINMITTGWDAFLKKPLFGNGTAHSYTLFKTYSHNNFIELLMNYGIVGFCFYYVPYVFLVCALLKQSKKGDKCAAYFLIYTTLHLGLGIGWVNYYERVVQLLSAAAWGYIECMKDRGSNV